jgi:hypothetical protein
MCQDEPKPSPQPSRSTLSRRSIIKGLVTTLAASKAPYIIAKPAITLRVLGTHVTLQEELRLKAMADLGFNITFEPKGSAAVLQKASLFPNHSIFMNNGRTASTFSGSLARFNLSIKNVSAIGTK